MIDLIKNYVQNVWEIFPVYQFYELKIPDVTNKVAIYSTISIADIEIEQECETKFFDIYSIYPKIHRCIGNLFVYKRNCISRLSAHSISACTEKATKKYINSTFRIIKYNNDFLDLVSFGTDAETITDLGKVLQVHISENK